MDNALAKEIIERLTRLEAQQKEIKEDVGNMANNSDRIIRLEERQNSNTKLIYGILGAVGILALEALKVFESSAIQSLLNNS